MPTRRRLYAAPARALVRGRSARCRCRRCPARRSARAGDACEPRRAASRSTATHLAAYDRVCGFRLARRAAADLPARARVPARDEADDRRASFPFARARARAHRQPDRAAAAAPRRRAARPARAGGEPARARRAAAVRPRRRGARRRRASSGAAAARTCAASGGGGRRRHGGRASDAEPPRAERGLERARRHRPPLRRRLGRPQPDPPARAARAAVRHAGPIAHGMWVKARCLAALEGHAAGRATRSRCAFKLPMLLPAKVAFADVDRRTPSARFAVHDARKGKPHLAGAVSRRPRRSGLIGRPAARVLDQRGEPLLARLLLLGADHPPDRGAAVAGRLRLEEVPGRRRRAELRLLLGRRARGSSRCS